MFASIVMPSASEAASRLYVSVSAGTSLSVALALNVSVAFSSTDRPLISASTGVSLALVNVILAAAAVVLSAPSLTLIEYAGAVSPPS